jgi:hypothetical protein
MTDCFCLIFDIPGTTVYKIMRKGCAE